MTVPARRSVPDARAIVVDGLAKSYGGRTVIDGLSFSVGTGEVFAILGPNGAGKTTTVEILEGYRRADAGSVRVLGLDPTTEADALRARIGLMLQGGGIYPQARPLEIIRLFASFYRHPHDPEDLIDRCGLRDVARSRYRTLSGGEKQRLGLALAVVGRPELVVLDEPTAGMDPAAKAATRNLVVELRSAGVTVLLTTHDLADVERLADRVALIAHGQLVTIGSPAEMIAGGGRALRFRLAAALEEDDRPSLEAALLGPAPRPNADRNEVALVTEGQTSYRVSGREPDPGLVARLAAWCAENDVEIVELRTTGGSLEDRYLELLAEAGE
jgi:ABC-2 type transport system ATP-binding protein